MRTTSEIVDQSSTAHAFRSRAKIYMASSTRTVATGEGANANGVACRCPCLTSNDTASVPRIPPQIIKFPLSQTNDINRARGKKLNFEVIEA